MFALGVIVIVAALAAVFLTVRRLSAGFEARLAEIADLKSAMESREQNQALLGAELKGELGRAQQTLEGVRTALGLRQQMEEEARQSLRRLEAVIAGSSTRGQAGENILEEALQHLPPEMLERNHWVRGKVVEFALRLPGGKVLPIDSKWASGGALEELAQEDLDPTRRQALVAAVEKEVQKRVREVSQYIDPQTTTPFALAAIPDGAFAVCRSAFADAHRRNVIVVGFSMAMPYVLSLYQLHLQFARGVDMENLQAYLIDIDRHLENLEGSLENKLRRAMTMLDNSYGDGKLAVAGVRAAVHAIQATARLEDGEGGLRLIEPAE